jgi:hypothetical protein
MYIFEKYVLTFQMHSLVKIISPLLLAFPVSDNNHPVELFQVLSGCLKSTHFFVIVKPMGQTKPMTPADDSLFPGIPAFVQEKND